MSLDDEELQRIREKKAQQLRQILEQRKSKMEQLKQEETAPKSITKEDKYRLMNYFLTDDAFSYWKSLYENPQKHNTAETIFINLLYLIKIGFMEGKLISLLGIKKLERKIDNIPSKITIKRKGEKERSKVLD
ncbi:MAG: hypothetical protein K9W45_06815 [Candidatus Heimdallarchaeum aukensis]|uniref:Uncharacterized protein n=1 Tax=Candidatus Heimdallarchaeum aukensis TaxID=2876573 RepID=A0A9Y1BIN3_9ARCH|nr:MAG: hypothetical protein K9W45_06815 [Candidatus Heimdallarchaeum aukensis]